MSQENKKLREELMQQQADVAAERRRLARDAVQQAADAEARAARENARLREELLQHRAATMDERRSLKREAARQATEAEELRAHCAQLEGAVATAREAERTAQARLSNVRLDRQRAEGKLKRRLQVLQDESRAQRATPGTESRQLHHTTERCGEVLGELAALRLEHESEEKEGALLRTQFSAAMGMLEHASEALLSQARLFPEEAVVESEAFRGLRAAEERQAEAFQRFCTTAGLQDVRWLQLEEAHERGIVRAAERAEATLETLLEDGHRAWQVSQLESSLSCVREELRSATSAAAAHGLDIAASVEAARSRARLELDEAWVQARFELTEVRDEWAYAHAEVCSQRDEALRQFHGELRSKEGRNADAEIGSMRLDLSISREELEEARSHGSEVHVELCGAKRDLQVVAARFSEVEASRARDASDRKRDQQQAHLEQLRYQEERALLVKEIDDFSTERLLLEQRLAALTERLPLLEDELAQALEEGQQSLQRLSKEGEKQRGHLAQALLRCGVLEAEGEAAQEERTRLCQELQERHQAEQKLRGQLRSARDDRAKERLRMEKQLERLRARAQALEHAEAAMEAQHAHSGREHHMIVEMLQDAQCEEISHRRKCEALQEQLLGCQQAAQTAEKWGQELSVRLQEETDQALEQRRIDLDAFRRRAGALAEELCSVRQEAAAAQSGQAESERSSGSMSYDDLRGRPPCGDVQSEQLYILEQRCELLYTEVESHEEDKRRLVAEREHARQQLDDAASQLEFFLADQHEGCGLHQEMAALAKKFEVLNRKHREQLGRPAGYGRHLKFEEILPSALPERVGELSAIHDEQFDEVHEREGELALPPRQAGAPAPAAQADMAMAQPCSGKPKATEAERLCEEHMAGMQGGFGSSGSFSLRLPPGLARTGRGATLTSAQEEGLDFPHRTLELSSGAEEAPGSEHLLVEAQRDFEQFARAVGFHGDLAPFWAEARVAALGDAGPPTLLTELDLASRSAPVAEDVQLGSFPTPPDSYRIPATAASVTAAAVIGIPCPAAAAAAVVAAASAATQVAAPAAAIHASKPAAEVPVVSTVADMPGATDHATISARVAGAPVGCYPDSPEKQPRLTRVYPSSPEAAWFSALASQERFAPTANDEAPAGASEGMPDAEEAFQCAQALSSQSRFQEAVPLLHAALKAMGDEPGELVALAQARAEVWAHLGVAMQSLDNVPEALEAYSRAVELDPSLHVCLANLATLHAFKSDQQSALEYIDRALALEPASAVYGQIRQELLHAMQHVQESTGSLGAA